MKNIFKILTLSLAIFATQEIEAYQSSYLTTYSDAYGSTTMGTIGNQSVYITTYGDSYGSSSYGSIGNDCVYFNTYGDSYGSSTYGSSAMIVCI